MNGRFRFYRRRRVLPFLAVYCLVCINGATLVPLPDMGIVPAPAGDADAFDHADSRPWANYERGCDRAEPESVAAGGLPPIVKNLRRSSPSRHGKTGSWGGGPRPPDSRALIAESVQQSLAVNTADLTRLCRRLL